MKRIILSVMFILSSLTVHASECTDYLMNLYSNSHSKPVKIICRKEFIDKYEQKIGDKFISSIVYGQADMKIQGQRKKVRVSYICLLENDCKPIWGYIIPR